MPYRPDFGAFNATGDPLTHPKTNHVLGGRLGVKHFTPAATSMASAASNVSSSTISTRRPVARASSAQASTSAAAATTVSGSSSSSASASPTSVTPRRQDHSLDAYSKSFSSSARSAKSPFAKLAELDDSDAEDAREASATTSYESLSSLSISPPLAIPRVSDDANRGRSRHRVPGGTSRRRGPPTERGRLRAARDGRTETKQVTVAELQAPSAVSAVKQEISRAASNAKAQQNDLPDVDLQFDLRLSDEEEEADDDDDNIIDPFSRPISSSTDIDYDAKPTLSSMGPIMARLPASTPDSVQERLPVGLSYLPASYPHGTRLVTSTKDVTREHHKYTRSRLPVLGPKSEALWKALHELRPNTYDYAGNFGVEDEGFCVDSTVKEPIKWSREAPHPVAPGTDISSCPAFTSDASPALSLIRRVLAWDKLSIPADLDGTWYGVIFRSKRRPFVHNIGLYEADRLAHEEAVSSGGLMMYWYGTPDALGSNLATCVWTSREAAKVASALPLHKKAASKSSKAYETFELARYRLVARDGRLSAEEWIEGGDGEEEMEGEGFR